MLTATTALTLVGAAAGQAQADTPPTGYYAGGTPAYGSTVQAEQFDFDVPLAMAPDKENTINTNPVSVDYGDGTKEEPNLYCRLASGGTTDADGCYTDVNGIVIPLGSLWISGGHEYRIAGTYHPKLTYKVALVPYSTSWTVVSPGASNAFYLAYDPDKVDVSIAPAVKDEGWQSYSEYGHPLHRYSAPASSTITVTAAPKQAGSTVGYVHEECLFVCWLESEPERVIRTPICGDSAANGNRCTYAIPNKESIAYDGYDGQTGFNAVAIDVTPPADTTPPVVSSALTPGEPDGANGWYTSDVTLGWSVSEAESTSSLTRTGCEDQHVTADQQQTSYSCAGTSDGGTSTASVTIKRDATAPVVAGAVKETPVTTGGTTWYKDRATLGWSATDRTSGLSSASLSPTSSTFGEGWNQTAAATADDNAGNHGTGTVSGVNVDATAPSVTASRTSGPVYGTDWYRDSVDISVTASDPALRDGHAGSGLATDPSGTTTRTSSGTYDATATDRVGHSTTSNSVSYSVDSQRPTVSISCPTGDVVKGATAAATWRATDPGDSSGLRTSASGNVPLDTATVGTHSATAPTAMDNVGHSSAAAACSYNVIYRWTSFLQPVDVGVLNTAKAGSAIPVKFTLGGDQGLGILAAGYPTATAITCSAQQPIDAIEELATASTSGLKYDATAGQYIYTWKTTSAMANTCQRLTVRLMDGTSHTADFKFS